MISRQPIIPERVRNIGSQSFAFIPHRFLRDGFLAALNPAQRSLYLFLVLAADRNGISFYNYERICSCLELTLDQYIDVRNALIDMDLVAFDGTRFQVLSLPDSPPASSTTPLRRAADLEDHDPATVSRIIRDSIGRSER